jgi:hypothetical protein
MTKEKEIEKPRGWANLRQQLKEVREESFKQGVWAGQNSQKKKCLKIIDEHIGCTDGDCLEVIKQKIKGDESE